MSLKNITKAYLFIYLLFMLTHLTLATPQRRGECANYTLPSAAIINEFDLEISNSDVDAYKKVFPQWGGAWIESQLGRLYPLH